MESEKADPMLIKLQSACSNLRILVETSTNLETSLSKMDKRFDLLQETLSTTSSTIAPLQSLAMACKALDARINRAVSPALSLLESFKLAESLQEKLLKISSKLPTKTKPSKRLKCLLKYVDCVDELNAAIDSICRDCEPAIQKLQEVVEFLSRTKATDHYRTCRLKDTLVTLKALYESEVDAMRYEGLLDEALLSLQDEYESILQQLKHKSIGEEVDEVTTDYPGLGSELEINVLNRIAESLARNDCLDICIDIYVKVRYTRAAKALMRLNPEYLRSYTPEEIDEMEWESLERAMTLWIQHFEVAVRRVLVSEKKLCREVLGEVMEGMIWAECFVKIADKIMAVFFRFGEGVTRSSKEPQKLFKLLDMFQCLENLKGEFGETFQGEAGADICLRFRELEKLLVHASSRVFLEFGLQIEGNQDGLNTPLHGSVPKLVRYAVNYLKYLATSNYSGSMLKVLQIEHIWKAGESSSSSDAQVLLEDAILNVMDALDRNINSKKLRYNKDSVMLHIFSMNTYWYIYMRTKNSELANLIGEQLLKKRYKTAAEESAYAYQRQAWWPVVGILENDDDELQPNPRPTDEARVKTESFIKAFNLNCQTHRTSYNISDDDLREQIREATVKLVVPAYASFTTCNPSIARLNSFLPPHAIEELLAQVFGATISNQTIVTSRRRFKNQSAAA